MSKKIVFITLLMFATLVLFQSSAEAGGHAYYGRGGFGLFGLKARPRCPIGAVGPGCRAPVRKTARFFGRLIFGRRA